MRTKSKGHRERVSCMKRKNTTNESDATKTRFPHTGKDQEDLFSKCLSPRLH